MEGQPFLRFLYDCDMICYETSKHAMFVHIAHSSSIVKARGGRFASIEPRSVKKVLAQRPATEFCGSQLQFNPKLTFFCSVSSTIQGDATLRGTFYL